MARALTLRPPAKINLTLRVGPRREDGFHEVQTVMQTIGICDVLTFMPKRGPLLLSTRPSTLAADRTNLIWRAAEVLWHAAGRIGDPRDVQIAVKKTIPLAAGLGGGSANAAATLVGLNQVWGLRLRRRDLVRLGASLGSDVPFFLSGGASIGVGRGDEVFPLRELPRFGVVVIKPAFGVSTADAYRWLDADRAAGLAHRRHSNRSLEVRWPSPLLLVNDLEDPVARRHPELAEAIETCLRAGAKAAAMTGSGSAVFGVFSTTVAAARAARRIARPDWQVLSARMLTRAESGRLMGL